MKYLIMQERILEMNLKIVLKKAWHILWNYRALWLFGMFLPIISANLISPASWFNREDNKQWILVKVTENFTLQIPGADATIDLTAPEGISIITPESPSWNEFQDLVEEVEREASIHLWPILIEFAVILAGSLLLGALARYIAETATIRMVNEAEESGKRSGVWEGLRRGWSPGAGRLFLLDLMLAVLAIIVFIGVFGLAVAPILLAIGSHEAILITVGVGTLGLLILASCAWFAALLLLSLVLQPIRRACVLEDQNLLASIYQGLGMIKRHLKEVGLVWLVWMGIQVVWVPLSGLILLLLVPVLLVAILFGAGLGGVSAALMAGITSVFTNGITAWIMGALAGVPVLIAVMASPMLFLYGLVKVYLSSIWTLAYRDLRVAKYPIQEPALQTKVMPALGMED
jgi:hypothetical protein